MTNQEILLKAWNLATDNGWEFDNLDKCEVRIEKITDTVMTNWYRYVFTLRGNYIREIDAERVIFDQDFAKALWGDAGLPNFTEFAKAINAPEYWQYHLQQMVISEDPIEYLGKNI
jgi:hypothetical protein